MYTRGSAGYSGWKAKPRRPASAPMVVWSAFLTSMNRKAWSSGGAVVSPGSRILTWPPCSTTNRRSGSSGSGSARTGRSNPTATCCSSTAGMPSTGVYGHAGGPVVVSSVVVPVVGSVVVVGPTVVVVGSGPVVLLGSTVVSPGPVGSPSVVGVWVGLVGVVGPGGGGGGVGGGGRGVGGAAVVATRAGQGGAEDDASQGEIIAHAEIHAAKLSRPARAPVDTT